MKATIIIPVHNPGSVLHACVGHLAKLQEIPLENLCVVDDGSTDGSAEWLAAHFPRVQVVRGDGSLLWTGAIRLGMEKALESGSSHIFWLNHDCKPEAGTLTKLAEFVSKPSIGCAGAWCFIDGHPESPVNPGFCQFRPVPLEELRRGNILPVQGLNGNLVCFSAEAVRAVGLPEARKYPHYGDGPYTLRFSRAGYGVFVDPAARAGLGYELERRLSPFWRVSLGKWGVLSWLHYFFFSFRSPYHLRNRWNEAIAFRGLFLGPIAFAKTESGVLFGSIFGWLVKCFLSRDILINQCISRHPRWPTEKLRAELGAARKQ